MLYPLFLICRLVVILVKAIIDGLKQDLLNSTDKKTRKRVQYNEGYEAGVKASKKSYGLKDHIENLRFKHPFYNGYITAVADVHIRRAVREEDGEDTIKNLEDKFI